MIRHLLLLGEQGGAGSSRAVGEPSKFSNNRSDIGGISGISVEDVPELHARECVYVQIVQPRNATPRHLRTPSHEKGIFQCSISGEFAIPGQQELPGTGYMGVVIP